MRPAVQAHRGSPLRSDGIEENTVAAFWRARDLGADSVELDVRLLADGGLAVHHDPTIAGIGPIHQLRTADLPAHVPLLADALTACAGLGVNVELKNLPPEPGFDPTEALARSVVDVLEGAGSGHHAGIGDSGGNLVISSFWSGALAAVRDTGSAIPTALLVLPGADVDRSLAAALDLGCAGLNLPIDLATPAAATAAQDAGLTVATWTVRERTDLDQALAAGVDVVITDDVADARLVVDALTR